jgi:peptidoglycan hydrolase-like protein with peptidoglycan-binding domain
VQTRGFAAAAVLGRWAWAAFARRPIDSFAILCAGTASVVIVVNAAFLQTGTRAAPFFALPVTPTASVDVRAVPAAPLTARTADPNPTNSVTPLQAHQVVPVPVPSPLRRDDPIAELIGPSPRVLAVQRVLSEFGYGQIKASGTLDAATSAAIEKFERDHKLPVSGRVSERLLNALAALAGHPIE